MSKDERGINIWFSPFLQTVVRLANRCKTCHVSCMLWPHKDYKELVHKIPKQCNNMAIPDGSLQHLLL